MVHGIEIEILKSGLQKRENFIELNKYTVVMGLRTIFYNEIDQRYALDLLNQSIIDQPNQNEIIEFGVCCHLIEIALKKKFKKESIEKF